MKIAVCVYQSLDPEMHLRVGPRGKLDDGHTARLMDPAAAAALEAAVSIAEQHGGDVSAFWAGPAASTAGEDLLRSALSHGAAVAVYVRDGQPADGAQAGKALARAIEHLGPFDLVLCGARSADDGSAMTGATVARELGRAVVQQVVALSVQAGALRAERRRDGGYREVVEASLPIVITADPLLAHPRFPTTQARLRARRTPITIVDSRDLGIESRPAPAARAYRTPPPRLHGIAWPEPGMSARERLKFLVRGGQSRVRTGAPVNGRPEEVAHELATFLRERGLVDEVGQ